MSEVAVADAVAETETTEVSGAGDGTDLNVEREDGATEQHAETETEDKAEDEGSRLEREAREAEIERRAEEIASNKLKELKAKDKATDKETAKQERASAIRSTKAGFGPTIAALEKSLIQAGFDGDLDEALKPIRDHNGKYAPLIDKFYDSASQEIADSLSDWFKDQVEGNEEIARMVDDGEELEKVLPAVIEALALKTDAVTKAKPDDLLEANKALKAYVAKQVDEAYKKGRKNPYPDGEPDHEGRVLPGKMTLAEIDVMPTPVWMAKPKEERDRLLAAARAG